MSVRIKVSWEVAVAIMAFGALVWLLAGSYTLKRWIERRLPPKAVIALACTLGTIATLVGGGLLSSFFSYVNNEPDNAYYTVRLDLNVVILTAVLLAIGGVMWAWGRLTVVGGVMCLLGGAAIALKPLAYPLISQGYGSGSYAVPAGPFSLTSETHLYFLLPGVALVMFGIGLFLKRVLNPARTLPGWR